jgi:hypothetical protein
LRTEGEDDHDAVGAEAHEGDVETIGLLVQF